MRLSLEGAGLVAFAGFVPAALLVAWLTWPEPPEPPEPPESCIRADELSGRLLAARSVLGQELARLQKVREEDLRMTGEPPERPADLPRELWGDDARAATQRALDAIGARVIDVTCEEYPCLAQVIWSGPAATPAPDPVELLMSAGLGLPGITGSVRVREGERSAAWVIALVASAPELTPGQQLRVQRRSAAALALAERARDAR